MAKNEKSQEMSIEAVQAQIAQMLEEAKAAAAKIVEDAQKAAGAKAEADAETERKIAELRARAEEYVEVKLFKDNGQYKDDVYVSVNGENCLIKRGERVKIKRKFAEVLDHSEYQDYETSKLIEEASRLSKLADM